MTSIDLRVEFEAILQKWGQIVYLQRNLSPFKDRPQYGKKLEKHLVRSMNVLASRFLADTKVESPEGTEFPTEMVFWFRHYVNPVAGDRIYFYIPRYPGLNDETDLNTVYEIDHADPKYGVNGRIEFWACGATREVPE